MGEYVATIGRVLEFDLNEPFGWGNIDAARYEAQISPLSEGIYRDEIVRSINPDFIIYTTNQWVELLKDKGTILYSIE